MGKADVATLCGVSWRVFWMGVHFPPFPPSKNVDTGWFDLSWWIFSTDFWLGGSFAYPKSVGNDGSLC